MEVGRMGMADSRYKVSFSGNENTLKLGCGEGYTTVLETTKVYTLKG